MEVKKTDIWGVTGRKIFLTGGSGGIGAAIKSKMIAEGCDVVAPSRSEVDLSSMESINNYILNHEMNDIDIFIHCAGLNKLAGISDIDNMIIDEVFNVNLFSAVTLLKAISDGMRERKWGRICLISSLYAIVSKEYRIAYSMSKNALTGLAKTLTLELAKDNILTNCIAPGYVLTDMTRNNLSEEELKDIVNKIPAGRLQSEEEIADTVLFLCSERNKSITGQLIAVDGGYICR